MLPGPLGGYEMKGIVSGIVGQQDEKEMSQNQGQTKIWNNQCMFTELSTTWRAVPVQDRPHVLEIVTLGWRCLEWVWRILFVSWLLVLVSLLLKNA